ncbi:MAG: Excinuclease ABC subunit B [Erysipelotrichaceae bacterium]|nr:MAG: Excinuclease ABC subunit [Erysipelotrichaceae bacterium]TXT19489.1 MAG: Excinuclease ABC subunit B [Erysipelotrichaceae bacterium]
MNEFKLVSPYSPTGDQPKAIEALVEGLNQHKRAQVLLGATGTGKTFTISKVIERVNRPTLVFVHNKTLAGQLYSEFKELFPENRVEYFVSNFDYYQPEAYLPTRDLYIEKASMINEELDMLRMSALNAVLERRDTIIVASVACIYASSDPELYRQLFFTIKVHENIKRAELLRKLVDRQYMRNDIDPKRGTFRVHGDVIEISLGFTDQFNLRIEMFGDEIERITEVDRVTGKIQNAYSVYNIFPANEYARSREQMLQACDRIEEELKERLEVLHNENKLLEEQRLKQRTLYDLEALREFGMCPGIENYSRHIDGRQEGQRSFNLFDYFPDDYLLVIDESHVSVPQVKGMYNGDRSRKTTLVEYGFRLPSALDNRPLRFTEFEDIINQVIFVSATPGDYELALTQGDVVQQIIRPTGLIDPEVIVRPSRGQIDDIISEVHARIDRDERVLITTLTVKMAEELTQYLKRLDLKVAYLHHETLTLERIEILHDLRKGKYNVLVGINLLREGLDLPEVSLVCILDADKEGFLRSHRSLIQTIGRAARNSNGKVILYADRITDSMEKALGETQRRRDIQIAHNTANNITPTTIKKEIHDVIRGKETKAMAKEYLNKHDKTTKGEKERLIESLEREMKDAAKVLDFERAAELRDILLELKAQI